MALTIVEITNANSSSTNGTSTTTNTFDSTGYHYIVAVGKNELSNPTITLSDNKSTVFTHLTKRVNGSNNLQAVLAWGPLTAPGSGHTVTVTFGASVNYHVVGLWLIDSDGAAIELVSGSDVGDTGTSTTIDAGTITTDAASVSVLFGCTRGGASYTASSGWTEDFDSAGAPSSYAFFSRADASAGTIDPSATISASEDWVAVAASFKAAVDITDWFTEARIVRRRGV